MTMRMSARAKFFLYLFLIFMVILTVIPLLYTVSASFKTNMEIATGGINLIPKTFTFDNYKTVWSMSGTGIASKVTYTDYTINSIKVSLMTVVLVVLFTSMSAYCFQRGNFPGQKFLYWLFMATMFIGAGNDVPAAADHHEARPQQPARSGAGPVRHGGREQPLFDDGLSQDHQQGTG